MNKAIRFAVPLLAVILAACAPSGAVREFRTSEELITYNFTEPRTFEEGTYTGSGATLRIVDGLYRIAIETGDNELWWGQWGDTLSNVVIDVDVEQTTERNENAYGVGCRMRGTVGQSVVLDATMMALTSENTEAAPEAQATLTEEATPEANHEATEQATLEVTLEATVEQTEEAIPEFEEGAVSEASASRLAEIEVANGDGYLFLIQGNGQFAIMRSSGRDLIPLVDWRLSGEINQGPGRNQLRAVCMDDYLAFYINGQFVADATDDTYSSGQVALVASAANRLGVRVEFDNLKVSRAES